MTLEITIEQLERDRLDELEPMWNALREHHLSVAPDWLPAPHERELAWHRRRSQYEEWLAADGAFVLVARRGPSKVGYALVHYAEHRRRGSSATAPERWRRCRCSPASAGAGPDGSCSTPCTRLLSLGATEVSLHLLSGNAQAERFYESQGFRPFAVWLTRPLSPPGPQESSA